MTVIENFDVRARRLLFNCSLRDFPILFELYARAMGIHGDYQEYVQEMVVIIRRAPDADSAWEQVCHYLDSIEGE